MKVNCRVQSVETMRTFRSDLMGIPSSIFQLLTSVGMLMVCGTIVQQAFRGIIFPYKSSVRVITYDGRADKLHAKFTRAVYFGAFSWLASLVIGAFLNYILTYFNGPNLIQMIASNLGVSSADAYALLASAILILVTTPIMCWVGSILRNKSGGEYEERMRLTR